MGKILAFAFKPPFMRRSLPSLLLFTLAPLAKGQTQNALDFDNNGDQVQVANASALIANQSGISLSCWVYPRNAAPNFPDFDGIAGFRNEVDCDFYLLHFTASSVEARMRNNAGEFTITGGPITLNTWQHLAFTYDGATLALYVNGTLASSVPASGTFTNTTTPLQIGDLTYQITEYWMNGRVDEVGLWKRALTTEEIGCLLSGAPDPTDTDLVLYYGCDQGTAGGNNAGITELTDATGTQNGVLEGFALSGNTSNFVEGTTVGTTIEASVCPGVTYPFNGTDVTAPGVYSAVFTGQSGCDSVVTLVLDLIQINTAVNQNGPNLTCLNGAANWQWVDCNNGYAAISGATFQTFTPQANGSFAVVVTQGECTDTSACYTVSTIGIDETGAVQALRLFPTVTDGAMRLVLDRPVGLVEWTMVDAQGRIVQAFQGPAVPEQRIDATALPAGLYSVRVRMAGEDTCLRFLRR